MRLSFNDPRRIRQLNEIANRSEIITDIRARVNERNENVLILVRGKPGSGKSFAGMRLGELITPDRFDMSFVAYDFIKFKEILRRDDLQKGDVIIWDEPGEGVSSDQWQGELNRITRKIFRLFRWKNLVVIMCAPNESWIDKKVRELFHAEIKCRSDWKVRTHGKPQMYSKFYWLEWNDRFQKTTRSFHKTEDMDVEWIKIPLPSDPIRTAYVQLMEKMKSAEMEELTAETPDKDTKKEKKEKKVFDAKKLADQVYADQDMFRGTEGNISVPLIMVQCNISQYRATAVKQLVEKKIAVCVS